MAQLIPGGRSAIRIFRAFHEVVVTAVERLQRDSRPAGAAPDIETVRAPLLAEIERYEQLLSEDPPTDPAVVDQIRHLLAVYADDRVLAAPSPVRHAWAERRIEEELFGTRLGFAGVEARSKRLLTAPTPENRQLARLFLYAFGLGLGSGDPAAAERLADLEKRLLHCARPARAPAAHGKRRLFRQAYRYTAAEVERRLLPDLRGWLLLAVVLLLVLILASTPAWRAAVETVAEKLASARADAVEPAPLPAAAEPAPDEPPARQAEPEEVDP